MCKKQGFLFVAYLRRATAMCTEICHKRVLMWFLVSGNSSADMCTEICHKRVLMWFLVSGNLSATCYVCKRACMDVFTYACMYVYMCVCTHRHKYSTVISCFMTKMILYFSNVCIHVSMYACVYTDDIRISSRLNNTKID